MADNIYLALVSGATTIELTDGVNYSIDDSTGWIPNVALDSDALTVVDTIQINILGANAYAIRKNLNALIAMLRQIERGQHDDGNVVRLHYISPNSAPRRVIASQVVRWDASAFLPNINGAENYVTNALEVVTLILEHRVPWVHLSFVYENLVPQSAWAVSPSPTTTGGATASYIQTNGFYGGRGAIQLTITATGLRTMTVSNNANARFAVTAGVPVYVTCTIGYTTGISQVSFFLASTFNGSANGNAAIVNVTGSAAIADGETVSVIVIPTQSGDVFPAWQVQGAAGSTFQVMEMFASASGNDTWHQTSTEESGTTNSSSALGLKQTTIVPLTSHRAPTKFQYSFGQYSMVTYASGLVAIAKAGDLIVDQFPPAQTLAAGFTSVADAANFAQGNILRYTPTTTSTIEQYLGGSPQLDRAIPLLAARVNGSASYQIELRVGFANGTSVQTQSVTLSPRTAPYYIALPLLALNSSQHGIGSMNLRVTATATGGSIDFDWWALVNDAVNTHIITHGQKSNVSGIIIDPRWTDAPLPTGVSSVDSLLVRTDADTLDTLWVATDGTTKWRLDPATNSPNLTITRPPAFDAPV